MSIAASADASAGDWGSSAESDDAVPLPPREESGPDASGVTTVIEYTRARDGSVKKHTRRVRIATKTVHAPAAAVARSARIRPFGRATSGNNSNTTSFDMNLVKLRLPGEEDDRDAEMEKALEKLKSRHTSRPRGEAAARSGMATSNWAKKMDVAEKVGFGGGDVDTSIGHTSAPSSGKFVPSAVARGGTAGPSHGMSVHDETPALKVSNLAEATTSLDLEDMFSPFGRVSRANVVTDRETAKSRCYGFVNFLSMRDAEAAKAELTRTKAHINGLVMDIAWASKPRTDTTYRSGYGQALPQG